MSYQQTSPTASWAVWAGAQPVHSALFTGYPIYIWPHQRELDKLEPVQCSSAEAIGMGELW